MTLRLPVDVSADGVDLPRDSRGWLTEWRPDDEQFWLRVGRRIARRNLFFSVLAEHAGFCLWSLWTVVVVNLPDAGITVSLSQQFWLTAAPNLIGSLLRIPYTFAVPRFGGRRWTAMSAGALLAPCLLVAIVVPSGWLRAQPSGTQFWILLACAATAGIGGGNFSSSMANISFFYPERRKGLALGINAAAGNLGVAVAQVVTPLVIVAGVPAAALTLPVHPVHLAYAGLVWLPLIVVAAVGAAWRMDSLAQARTDGTSYRAALRNPHTWVVSLLYVGTFGSFIGFSFALPLVIKTTFPAFLAQHPFIATYLGGLAFVGALVGSLARPAGGWLAHRAGGSRVTLSCFIGMAMASGVAIAGVDRHSFPAFVAAFVAVFLLAGAGNGATYRMIPAIFTALAHRQVPEGAAVEPSMQMAKRRAAAVIGIAGAIGAFGGFLVQVVLRQAGQQVSTAMTAATTPAQKAAVAAAHSAWAAPALWAFIAGYVVLAALTWATYLRPSAQRGRVGFAVDVATV